MKRRRAAEEKQCEVRVISFIFSTLLKNYNSLYTFDNINFLGGVPRLKVA